MIFEESHIYKAGMFYKEVGALLTNPSTTIKDLVRFELKHNVKLDIKFVNEMEESNGSAEQK